MEAEGKGDTRQSKSIETERTRRRLTLFHRMAKAIDKVDVAPWFVGQQGQEQGGKTKTLNQNCIPKITNRWQKLHIVGVNVRKSVLRRRRRRRKWGAPLYVGERAARSSKGESERERVDKESGGRESLCVEIKINQERGRGGAQLEVTQIYCSCVTRREKGKRESERESRNANVEATMSNSGTRRHMSSDKWTSIVTRSHQICTRYFLDDPLSQLQIFCPL